MISVVKIIINLIRIRQQFHKYRSLKTLVKKMKKNMNTYMKKKRKKKMEMTQAKMFNKVNMILFKMLLFSKNRFHIHRKRLLKYKHSLLQNQRKVKLKMLHNFLDHVVKNLSLQRNLFKHSNLSSPQIYQSSKQLASPPKEKVSCLKIKLCHLNYENI